MGAPSAYAYPLSFFAVFDVASAAVRNFCLEGMMQDFLIGDQVATFVEGAIVGDRIDERGQMFKVAYELPGGEVRARWFYPEELYHDGDDDDGGCECELVNAVAALN